MDITFSCDKCGQSIVVDGAGAGVDVECPNCHQPLRVPSAESKTGKVLHDVRQWLGSRIEQARNVKHERELKVTGKQNQQAVAEIHNRLRTLEKPMSDCDVVTTALESNFQRGNVPSPTHLEQLAAGHLEELIAAAESFIYVNLISPFLGSTRQWLEELTQENPNDKRIGVLTPLLDKWTTIRKAGGLKEADYRCFIADLSEISEQQTGFLQVR